MVVAHSRERKLWYAVESTLATPPTDWDNMVGVTTGSQFRAIDPDVAGLQQDLHDNNNTVGDLNGRGNDRHEQILGVKSNGSFGFSVYAEGNTSTAASGSQATHYHLSRFLQSGLGGAQLSYHYGVGVGSSTTSVVLENATGLNAGMWGFFIDASDSSNNKFAQITAISGQTLTVRPALPFTPVEGDTMQAAINIYQDTDSLGDHTDTQHTTLSFLTVGWDSEDAYQCEGCKPGVELSGLEQNNQAMFSFDWQMIDYENDDTNITLPAADSDGRIGTGSLGDVEATTPQTVAVGNNCSVVFGPHTGSLSSETLVSVTPRFGINWQKVPSIAGENGVAHFNCEFPTDPGLDMVLFYSASFAREFGESTRPEKGCLIQVGTEAGKAYAIFYPRLSYAADPTRGDTAQRTHSNLSFRALHDDFTDVSSLSGDSKESVRSPVHIILSA